MDISAYTDLEDHVLYSPMKTLFTSIHIVPVTMNEKIPRRRFFSEKSSGNFLDERIHEMLSFWRKMRLDDRPRTFQIFMNDTQLEINNDPLFLTFFRDRDDNKQRARDNTGKIYTPQEVLDLFKDLFSKYKALPVLIGTVMSEKEHPIRRYDVEHQFALLRAYARGEGTLPSEPIESKWVRDFLAGRHQRNDPSSPTPAEAQASETPPYTAPEVTPSKTPEPRPMPSKGKLKNRVKPRHEPGGAKKPQLPVEDIDRKSAQFPRWMEDPRIRAILIKGHEDLTDAYRDKGAFSTAMMAKAINELPHPSNAAPTKCTPQMIRSYKHRHFGSRNRAFVEFLRNTLSGEHLDQLLAEAYASLRKMRIAKRVHKPHRIHPLTPKPAQQLRVKKESPPAQRPAPDEARLKRIIDELIGTIEGEHDLAKETGRSETRTRFSCSIFTLDCSVQTLKGNGESGGMTPTAFITAASKEPSERSSDYRLAEFLASALQDEEHPLRRELHKRYPNIRRIRVLWQVPTSTHSHSSPYPSRVLTTIDLPD